MPLASLTSIVQANLQLESISGIGPSKATAIIAYRNEHGPFKSIQDVVNVSGVGPKTVEKIAAEAYVISQ